MELFIPSVLVLLVAAAVIFFVLPRFGAPVLALISVALLVYGIYQHMNAFGSEYRLSTWQLGLVNYAPYIMIGGLLVVIAFYLITLSPLGRVNSGTTAPSMPEIPTVAEMPNANTATNAITAGVNNTLKAAANVAGNAAAAIGLGNAAKKNNNKGAEALAAAPAAAAAAANSVATGAAEAMNKAATGAVNAVNKAANAAKNAFAAITGNNASRNQSKPPSETNLTAALGLGANKGGNKGTRVPGINFRLSEV